ncbi:MAG: hypothetical protein LBL90_01010 [Prevotellaceae bacterium]|jgi:hypothetical protein|nr:hypothetical protein [Prevotellaceae bacterium]
MKKKQKNLPYATNLFNQFVKLLHKHHRQEWNAAFYTGQMCLTPKYLS